MPLSPDERRGRAQLAARTRWHGESAELTDEAAAIQQAALDRHIAELVKNAPKMTAEQADRLRRLFKYAPAEGGAAG